MNTLRFSVARRFLSSRTIELRTTDRSFGITVDVFDGDENVGYIRAIPMLQQDLEPDCRRAFDKALRQIPLEHADVFKVQHARLDQEYRGKGIGTDMYVKLVRVAADEGGLVVPDGCFSDGSGTLEEAWRVWEGSTFQNEVRVFDDLVTWGG